MVMSGNGFKTCIMRITTVLQQTAVLGIMALTRSGGLFGANQPVDGSVAVVAGATTPRTAGRRIAATTTLAAATASAVSAFLRRRSHFLLYPFTTCVSSGRIENTYG